MKRQHRSARFKVTLALVSLLCFGSPTLADNSDVQIARQAWPMIESGILLIDVRTPEEFAEGHLDGAINIEYEQTDALVAAIGNNKQRQVVLYCRSGNRVGKAMAVLHSKGYTGLFNAKSYLALKETEPDL